MPRTKATKERAAPEADNDADRFTDLIPGIFQQTQVSLANHRKNIVALSKSFSGCAGIVEEVSGGIRLTGEKEFQKTFARMVNNVLPVKKGVSNADKVVKFIGGFVKYITDKGESSLSTNEHILNRPQPPVKRRKAGKRRIVTMMIHRPLVSLPIF